MKFLTATATATSLLYAALLAANPVQAGSYVSEKTQDYIVRCSTVRTTDLPDQILERYGLAASTPQGVLSCVLQKETTDGFPKNVPADFEVRIENMMGVAQNVQVKELLEGDQITYLTTYDISNPVALRFEVTLSPQGSDLSIPLEFEDTTPES